MGIHLENTFEDLVSWICVYTNTSQSTAFASANTPVPLNRSADLTTQLSKNMSVNSDGIITTGNKGLYLCTMNATFSGAVNDDFTLYYNINDVQQTAGTIKWTQKGGNYWEVSSSVIIEIDSGIEVDLYVENNSDTTSLSLRNITQTMVKLY